MRRGRCDGRFVVLGYRVVLYRLINREEDIDLVRLGYCFGRFGLYEARGCVDASVRNV